MLLNPDEYNWMVLTLVYDKNVLIQLSSLWYKYSDGDLEDLIFKQLASFKNYNTSIFNSY